MKKKTLYLPDGSFATIFHPRDALDYIRFYAGDDICDLVEELIDALDEMEDKVEELEDKVAVLEEAVEELEDEVTVLEDEIYKEETQK